MLGHGLGATTNDMFTQPMVVGAVLLAAVLIDLVGRGRGERIG